MSLKFPSLQQLSFLVSLLTADSFPLPSPRGSNQVLDVCARVRAHMNACTCTRMHAQGERVLRFVVIDVPCVGHCRGLNSALRKQLDRRHQSGQVAHDLLLFFQKSGDTSVFSPVRSKENHFLMGSGMKGRSCYAAQLSGLLCTSAHGRPLVVQGCVYLNCLRASVGRLHCPPVHSGILMGVLPERAEGAGELHPAEPWQSVAWARKSQAWAFVPSFCSLPSFLLLLHD